MKNEILDCLFALADTKYRDFQSALLPTVDKSCFIGVRTPELRAYARKMLADGSANDFIHTLPHKYFDENQLHAFILSAVKDFDSAIKGVNEFLPWVDNWATCDQMSPKVFARNTDLLIPWIEKWIGSKHVYTVRFAVLNLMRYFLDDDFDEKYADMVADIKSGEYYVNMMRAWYFATGAAKQFDRILPYFGNGKLDEWTRKHAIQKALESLRVSEKNKDFLRKLR